MTALREYLAAQAELGTDEIILPQALVMAKPLQAEKSRPKAGATEGVTEAIRGPAKQADGGGDGSLLKMLHDSLRKQPVEAVPIGNAAVAKTSESPTPALPKFASLEVYWEQVEK